MEIRRSKAERSRAVSRRDDAGRLVVAGGRVLTVCARGETVEAARALALGRAERLGFEGRQLRRDIGAGAPGR